MKNCAIFLLLIVITACSQQAVVSNHTFTDSDLDGVHDSRDACPDEAGSLFNLGCPQSEPKLAKSFNQKKSTDSDLDGIPDSKDQCVFTYGSPFNQGCPMTEINY